VLLPIDMGPSHLPANGFVRKPIAYASCKN
jgi:hypothetical protein